MVSRLSCMLTLVHFYRFTAQFTGLVWQQAAHSWHKRCRKEGFGSVGTFRVWVLLEGVFWAVRDLGGEGGGHLDLFSSV